MAYRTRCVTRLTTLLVQKSVGKAIVWPQNNSIRLSGDSRPEPDVTLLRWREDYYAGKQPTSEDVLLVIEVSETSLKYDRVVKGQLYAQAGIPAYWIVNLRADVIEVYTNPAGDAYQVVGQTKRGEKLILPGVVGDIIEIDDILGQKRK